MQRRSFLRGLGASGLAALMANRTEAWAKGLVPEVHRIASIVRHPYREDEAGAGRPKARSSDLVHHGMEPRSSGLRERPISPGRPHRWPEGSAASSAVPPAMATRLMKAPISGSA